LKYRLLLAVIVMGILGVASFFAYAQSDPDSTATPAASSVIQEDIFVRGGPGRDYLPVGKLLAGDRVRPLSRNAASDWVLIVYGKNYGWIRRDLAFWVENIDALPVMDTANLTPSPVIPTTPANTPVLAATETPSGNWVELSTDAQSGYVRGGPGRTYLRLGQLYTGDAVEPVSRNEDGTWVMIRFGEGFGWISRNLVRWIVDVDALPVVLADNLTPTATFTATDTPTGTLTPTSSYTPTQTPTATSTATTTYTATVEPSATSTLTPTITPSETTTSTPEPSATPQPTLTATIPPSETPVPTVTSTVTTAPSATSTLEPSATPQPTLTATISPSETSAPTVTNTATTAPSATLIEPTATFTEAPSLTPLPTETSAAAAVVASATSTLAPTSTPTEVIPTATHTATEVELILTPVPPTSTQIPSLTSTLTATLIPATATLQPATATSVPDTVVPTSTVTDIPATVVSATSQSSATSTQATGSVVSAAAPTLVPEVSQPFSGGGLPAEAIIAGIALLGILIYGFFYWRGLSTAERYANGFVIDTCPVCGRGHLIVETRQERLFGVPRVRHSVRCSECRSVLREVGEQQWRYAVDPIENPVLYEQYNGKIISDDTLVTLATRKQPPPE